MNQRDLLRKVKQMQEEMLEAQNEIETTKFNASAGGVVTVSVFGTKHLDSITIDESFEIESKEDLEMLCEMIVAACKQAYKEIDQATKERLGKYEAMFGGMNPFL